jgi:hypothetical protein
MHKCIQKILLAACIVAMPVTTHAGPIDPGNGYTRDDASVVVQGVGLEWLKWDVTVGQSIESALRLYADQGWRLATNSEMADLFNDFDFGGLFSAQEDFELRVATDWSAEETGVHIDFIDLFGFTQLLYGPAYELTDPSVASFALFGSDDDNDGGFKLAVVGDDLTRTVEIIGVRNPFKNDAYATFVRDGFPVDLRVDNYGIALVRSVSVPEPGTFALLSLGLLGLGLNRRIHRKTL